MEGVSGGRGGGRGRGRRGRAQRREEREAPVVPDDAAEETDGVEDFGFGDFDTEKLDTAERARITEARAAADRATRAAERAAEQPATGEGPVAEGEVGVGPPSADRPLGGSPLSQQLAQVRQRRRQHRRDLPARVRRRQAIAAGVVGVGVLVGGYLLLAGGEDNPPEPLAIKRVIGQTVIGKVGKGVPSEQLLRRVRRGQIGGVIITGGTELSLLSKTEALQAAAAEGGNPPLLIMIDQEGGPVKRLPGPPRIAPVAFGDHAGGDAAKQEGQATGEYLAKLGINVDLAPVLDVRVDKTEKSLAERTFGDNPSTVSDLGVSFGEGLQDAGLAATAKHFPGLGPATSNTDDSAVTVTASASVLDQALSPFRDAVDAGFDLVMVASAVYPAYSAETRDPAVFSPKVITGLLRDELGFDGVVITDDLEAVAPAAQLDPPRGAVQAIRAGSDLVLLASTTNGSARAFDELVRAAKSDRLSRDQLEAAYDRVLALKEKLAGN